MATHANTEARSSRRDAALAGTCAALLGLTLLSAHAVSGTYAKYVARGTGSDTARVAKFGQVSIQGGGNIAISGSSAMNVTTQTDLDAGSAIALYANDDAAQQGQPVKVVATQTDVAMKIVLTITGAGWHYGTDSDGRDIMYEGNYLSDGTGVWFELGDGWEHVDGTDGTVRFSYVVPAGEALDSSVMRYDRIYSSLTVEQRAALADPGSASLTFSAEAVQID